MPAPVYAQDMPLGWNAGLIAAGVTPDAIESLAELFLIIAIAPRRKLAVACMHCRRLSPDEGPSSSLSDCSSARIARMPKPCCRTG